MTTSVPSLLAYGFLLGWSVAWPPGPINAEIARRCLARGFWAGYLVCVGAACGDAIWALLVVLGIGALIAGDTMRMVLGVLSTGLLLALAWLFLSSAWRSYVEGTAAAGPANPASSGGRGSYLLGLTMALTSPWNIAFWLAVMGRPDLSQLGVSAALVVIAAVLSGALLWGVVWAGAVVRLRRRATGVVWDVAVKCLTGLLMLYFAGRTIIGLIG